VLGRFGSDLAGLLLDGIRDRPQPLVLNRVDGINIPATNPAAAAPIASPSQFSCAMPAPPGNCSRRARVLNPLPAPFHTEHP